MSEHAEFGALGTLEIGGCDLMPKLCGGAVHFE